MRPPEGLKPEWRVEEERARAVVAALGRYLATDRPIPTDWCDELRRRVAAVNEHRKESSR